LNGNYTIFGQCDEATVALVKQIARMGRDSNDRPYRPVKINHITVTKAGAAATAKPAAARPAPAKPAATPAPAAKKPAAPKP
jgi:peptidyl-prolyl cis-trans isomerase A (cyclophilin A)